MDKPTKSLVSGVLLVAGAMSLGYFETGRSERRVETLRMACVDQGQREAKEKATTSWTLICDPTELAKSSEAYVGVQKEIAVAQRRVWAWKSMTAPFAVVAGGLLALPSGWYFLLRRVRELRDAVGGR